MNVMNALVSNRFSTMAGIDDRAKRMQLISSPLLGIASALYVFAIRPLAPSRSSRSSRCRCPSCSTTW